MSDEGGVAAVDRALSILDALTDEKISLAELSKRTGLYKSTVLRLLASLLRAGFVQRDAHGHYRPGREIARLQMQVKSVEETYGIDNLHLTVTRGYVRKLLGNARVVRWLTQHRQEYLTEFQAVAELEGGLPDRLGLRLDRRTRMMYDDRHVFINGESFGVAVGFSDRDAKTPMRASDRMLAGSTGKTFAAAVALRQTELRHICTRTNAAGLLDSFIAANPKAAT